MHLVMICQLNISIVYQLFIVNNLDMVIIEHMQTLHMFIAYLEYTRVLSFEKLKLLFMYGSKVTLEWMQKSTVLLPGCIVDQLLITCILCKLALSIYDK